MVATAPSLGRLLPLRNAAAEMRLDVFPTLSREAREPAILGGRWSCDCGCEAVLGLGPAGNALGGAPGLDGGVWNAGDSVPLVEPGPRGTCAR